MEIHSKMDNSLYGAAHRNERENPKSDSSWGFRFVHGIFATFFNQIHHMPFPQKSQGKNKSQKDAKMMPKI